MGLNTKGTGNRKDELNRCMPAASNAKLGDVLDDLITKHNALLAKLDADAGVTDTNYVATLKVTALQDR